MILEHGSKILVSHRRQYEGDHARFFVGVVEDYEHGVVRATGHTWLRDGYQGVFKRKDDERTKIFSLDSGAVIVYALPSTVNLSTLTFDAQGGELALRDDFGFAMDMSEGILHGASPNLRSLERRAL
jgi:hypothetical protein